MRLKTIRVREFKSVWDSEPFSVDRITCLVGKNEAGKTALLQALYRLNPIVPGDGEFDTTEDYPRSEVEDYLQGVEQGRPHANVIAATFELDAEELAQVEETYGPGALVAPELTLFKGYARDSKRRSTRTFSLLVDESIIAANLVKRFAPPTDDAVALAPSKSLSELAALAATLSKQHEANATAATTKAKENEDEGARAQALEAAKEALIYSGDPGCSTGPHLAKILT